MELPEVEIKHVLYATDFSENAGHVCAYAQHFAKQLQAKLTLLHVIPEEFLDLLIFDVGIDRVGGVEKRLSLMKEHFKDVKNSVVKKIKTEYGCEVFQENDIVVERGNPVKIILRTAEERGCDLIVMGFRGKGALEDAMMGDTVRRVLHRSKVPVLVVKSGDKKKQK